MFLITYLRVILCLIISMRTTVELQYHVSEIIFEYTKSCHSAHLFALTSTLPFPPKYFSMKLFLPTVCFTTHLAELYISHNQSTSNRLLTVPCCHLPAVQDAWREVTWPWEETEIGQQGWGIWGVVTKAGQWMWNNLLHGNYCATGRWL